MVNTFEVYESEYTEIGKSLANKLTTRFKCPFYVSFNLDDEMLNVNMPLYFNIEKDIFETMKNFIDNSS
jgi:hypothetical protein